jgi:6,7-dimethyl-8-ribityllumazine synthase
MQIDKCTPVACLAELVKRDGNMMRYDDCVQFASEHNLVIVTVESIKKYIDENLVDNCRAISSCDIYLESEEDNLWKLICYNSGDPNNPHKVLVKGNLSDNEEVMLRIHSECFTGDVLGSMMCDCGEQLKRSLKMISENKSGIIIFPANHEGRGIGLVNKVKAYKIMKDSNYKIDTYEANRILGFNDDQRSYEDVGKILDDLGVNKINLLTNNEIKIQALQNKIQTVTPLICQPNKYNKHYLQTKNIPNIPTRTMDKIEKFNNTAYKTLLPNNYKISIITTHWHSELVDSFYNQIKTELVLLGIAESSITKYTVPGAFEIPFCLQRIIETVHVIICLGLVIKGDTHHFEIISETVANSIMQIQLEHNTPIINGIINCYNLDQAVERYNQSSGMAKSLALSAINMI